MNRRWRGIWEQDRETLEGGRWWFLYATGTYVARTRRRKVMREKRAEAAHLIEAMRLQEGTW